jgi:glycerol-3-phosphate acyltransferase PlsX
MGGDHAPAAVVAGVLEALRGAPGRFTVLLAGPAQRMQEELARASQPGDAGLVRRSCTVVDAPDVITMDDVPTAALKAKKDSSIALGMALHRDGRAEAFVSAGNTGAVLSASTLILGRIEGVGRPTIGALLPTAGKTCLLLDAGANVDCKPRHLLEFGVMGSVYMGEMEGRRRPSVGLLNIGEEEGKGNEVSQEAYRLMKAGPLNFAGNVEGRDILTGMVDVVVCDGFVGNILLKLGESIPAFLKARLTAFASGRPLHTLALGLSRGSLRAVFTALDYQEQGGVPLLGVNGVSLIGHGSSTPKAIKNMIYRAEELVRHQLHRKIHDAMVTAA